MKRFSILILSLFTSYCYADNTTNLRVNQITFPNGSIQVSSPTVGVSGINLDDKGNNEVVASTSINIGTGLTLDGKTINNSVVDTTALPVFSIVIATYSGVGIDYACDGSSDEVEFAQAINESANSIIYVKDGTYTFYSSATFKLESVTLLANNAVIQKIAGSVINTIFKSEADYTTIKGFTFNMNHWAGAGTGYNQPLIYFMSNKCDYATIENCIFKNVENLTYAYCFWHEGPNVGGKFQNITFDDCDATYVCRIEGAYDVLSHILSLNSVGGIYLLAAYCGIYDYTNKGGTTALFLNSLTSNLILSGFNWYDIYQGIACYSADNVSVSDGVIELVDYYCVISDGPEDKWSFDNVRFLNSAGHTNGGTAYDAVYLAGEDFTFSNCTFSGVVDDKVFEITSDAKNTKIVNCNMVGVTGNTAYINDLGAETYASGNSPSQCNFDVLIDSQTAGGCPNFIPIKIGTPATTKVDYNKWVSTGTTNLGDWKKVSP